MIHNNTLLNINRNMRYLDKLIQQIESTKKIRVPSDDPIIASRALKFRTNVAETVQFQRNVHNGIAWMNITQSSFTNVIENLLVQFRERCVEAATGTEQPFPDKAAIVAELYELIDQIGVEMNQTYAGRYVFSGFRTDMPPVFIEANEQAYQITQQFGLKDIEKTKSYQKVIDLEDGNDIKTILDDLITANGWDLSIKADYEAYLDSVEYKKYGAYAGSVNEPLLNDIYLIKLAYRDNDMRPMTELSITINNGQPFMVNGSPVTINTYKATDLNAYTPDPGEINYIPETGELIIGESIARTFPVDGVEINYIKNGFEKGELNPVVYFPCQELFYNEDVYTMRQQAEVSRGVVDMAFNNSDYSSVAYSADILAYSRCDFADLVSWGYAGDQNNIGAIQSFMNQNPAFDGWLYIDEDYGRIIMNNATASTFPPGATIEYVLNPMPSPSKMPTSSSLSIINITTNPLAVPLVGKYYDMENQDYQYEFATRTYVTINSLAKNVYTDKMYADLKAVCDFVTSLEVSDPKVLEEYYRTVHGLSGFDLDNAVKEQLAAENSKMQAAIYDRFNNMLYLVDRHAETAVKEQTILGARMLRLDLLQARLEQDEDNYMQLLSDNEDTDMVKAIILKAAAEAAYLASLQASANIVQLSLANFIR